ncbi:hypothetical protein GA0115261_103561, partial [Streptomyces sp. OspMP-M43]
PAVPAAAGPGRAAGAPAVIGHGPQRLMW